MRQIEEEIRDFIAIEIINKRVKNQDKLFSLKFLTRKFKVNPSYVECAYKIMLKDRMIERRVDSYYIKVSEKRIAVLRQEFLNRYTNDYLENLAKIGGSIKDAKEVISIRDVANG